MGQIFPVKDLAQYGLITDVDPYDLPPNAWSSAVNVRFQNNKVTRGPVCRNVKGPLAFTDPRFVLGSQPNSGQDLLFIGYLNGQLTSFVGGTETSVIPTTYTLTSTDAIYTATRLANVQYVNRSDRNPWFLLPGASTFVDLSTVSWPANTTANILRSVGGALCAFNITQNGVQSPTGVITSNFPTAGTVPSTFNTNVSTDATSNILPEFEGEILDAQTLQNIMYIYGENEVWQMVQVGGTEVFDYSLLFTNRGVINSNCVFEYNGLHYVFGTNDIWVHDGVTPRSIVTDRTREFIFGGLDATFANRCQVYWDNLLQTINFAYRSGDALAKFTNSPDGANRQVVYDPARDRWVADDLPLTFFAGRANLDTSIEYATANQTYSNIGGTYQSLSDTFKKSTVFVGDSNTAANLTESLYAHDPSGPLSQVSSPIDPNATQPSFLERTGIDLDQLGADLKGYKVCQSIYPQGRLDMNASPLVFTMGAADFFNEDETVDPVTMTYDGLSNYKLDFGIAGRWLDIQILSPSFLFFSLSKLDLDLDTFGER
jgi:hypothetical protein